MAQRHALATSRQTTQRVARSYSSITSQLVRRSCINRSFGSLAVLPRWIPAKKHDRLALDKTLSQQEKSLLQSAEINVSKFFLKIRKQMLETSRVENDFSYAIFEPVLKRLILNMIFNFEKELAIQNSEMNRFYHEAISLLHEDIPYKKTMRFMVRYLHYVDELFLKIHPTLTSSFHRNNAEHVLEVLLNRAPNVLLYPSFQSVDIDYFLRTRAAPFHIVGIDLSGFMPDENVPYADGFPMKPSEFFWHDIGHDEYMEDADYAYIKSTFKPIERVVQEWFLTSQRIISYLNTIKDNKNLYDAAKLILFEILHERGFQYSLAVLKAQLDTPKWTEILNRKFKNNYYKNSPEINLSLFAELENARNNLLSFVDNSRCKDQKAHIDALYGEQLAVRVTHFPKVNYGQGFLERIILDESGASVLLREKNNKTSTCKVSELILAQINPTTNTPFDKETRCRIEMVLDLRKKNSQIKHIVMTLAREFYVVFTDGKQISLDEFIPHVQEKEIADKNRHYFEIEQVWGSYERGELLSYTHQERSSVHIGTVHYDLTRKQLEVITDETTFALSLSEVLIDPLQKEDFVNAARNAYFRV